MVDRVSPVRKIAFSFVLPCLLCYLPESGVSINTCAPRAGGGGGGGGGSHVAFRL